MEDAPLWGRDMSFAERLAKLRKQRGLTQQALADSAGIHMMQVHRYESGSSLPSVDALKKLTVALRVSADELLFEETERDPDQELKLLFEGVSRLGPEEKRTVREVLEGLLLKHDARRWMRSGTEG
jgi:transcriptional regulator with XRE-family HTH domain